MWITTRALTQAAVRAVVALGLALTTVAAGSPETFKATAAVKSPKANASAPVMIQIDKFVSDADRERLVGVFKANDDRATREALAKMPDIGFVDVGGKRSPIKYAYARPSGGGSKWWWTCFRRMIAGSSSHARGVVASHATR